MQDFSRLYKYWTSKFSDKIKNVDPIMLNDIFRNLAQKPNDVNKI